MQFFIGNSVIVYSGLLINMPYGMILNFIYITYSQTADGLRLQALTPLPEAGFPTQHRQHSGQSSVNPQSHSSSSSTTALPQNERLRATNKVFIPVVILLCLYRELQPQKTKKAPHHRHQTQSTENPNPKNPIQDPNPKTTTNEQK